MLLNDIRFAWRTLMRSPSFFLIAVLTLALGIGANTAIFSVVKTVLLDPLAYRDPGRIVAIQTWWTKERRLGRNISGGDYPDLIAQPSPFAAASRYAGGQIAVESGGQGEFATGFGIDNGFADVFQVRPIAGRLITPDEFRTKTKVALVSEGFALRHFGSVSGAVGKTLRIETYTTQIVGVLPADFHFPPQAELWYPMPWENASRDAGNYRAIALLKPGATPEAASVRLAAVGAQLQQAFPSHKFKSFVATPLKDLFVENSRRTLWLLMASVSLVLLIACVNVANLLLARATARSREFALRAALGAGRRRLMGQLLIESILLSTAGGALGLALAFAGVEMLLRLAPPSLPRLAEIHVNSSALLFNLVITLGAALLFGLWPALRATRIDLNDALKQGGARGILGGGRGEWVRGALASAEVALALVLTLGAGLLLRSFLALSNVDLGYQTENRLVLAASIPAKIGITAEPDAQHLEAGATFERIFAALRELPGVTAAAGVMGLPGGPYGSDGLYAVEGMHEFTAAQFDKLPHAGFRLTSPSYFQAMGVPLLAGRDFNERDLYPAEPVVIVSAAVVREVFHGQSPLDRRIKCGLDRNVWMRVVGVVGDMRNENPATPPGPELYMPYRQHPYAATDLHIVVRSATDIAAAARKAIATIDPGIPLKASTLEHFYSDSIALPRFRTLLLILFAGLAATLATVGVYGVMSYVAAQREPEIGVRAALGATASDILLLVLGSAGKLTVIGLALGVAMAFAAGRLIQAMLFGVKLDDRLSIAGAVGLLSAAALLAALIPALRAARVDPAAVLHRE